MGLYADSHDFPSNRLHATQITDSHVLRVRLEMSRNAPAAAWT